MKLLSLSGLVTATAAASLWVAAMAPASVAGGCAFSKGGTPEIMSSFDGPAGFLADSPDGKALGSALGGFGAVVALLTGGTVVYRRRRLAQVADANAMAMLAEADLALQTRSESVVVDSAGSAEAELNEEVVLSR